MKTATPDDYRRLIQIGESALKNTDAHWHEIPVERIPVARFGQGLDATFVAVGNLMLGQVDLARAWFAITAQFFLEANRSLDTVFSEKRALECALFYGDKEFRLKVAQQILPREAWIKPMEHSYTMFLKHMILGQDREASAFAQESAWLSRATMKKRGGYGALQKTCLALAGKRPDEFTAALEALLNEHNIK